MPTIINLRGTSGSGKSTVVRRVMEAEREAFRPLLPLYQEGRRQPLAYRTAGSGGSPTLFIPGHYETPCGGCDTITKPDTVYELVRDAAVRGDNVIYEGIIIQDDTKRLLALNAEYPVHVIELDTPIDECLAGIQIRRDERGDTRPLNPKNTVDRAARVHKICDKLRAQGLNIPILGREEAFQHCIGLLTAT